MATCVAEALRQDCLEQVRRPFPPRLSSFVPVLWFTAEHSSFHQNSDISHIIRSSISYLTHLNSHQALLSPPGVHLISLQLLGNLQRAQGLHVHHQALLQGGPHHSQPRVLQDQPRGRPALQLQPRGAAGDDDHTSAGRRKRIKPSCHPTVSPQVAFSYISTLFASIVVFKTDNLGNEKVFLIQYMFILTGRHTYARQTTACCKWLGRSCSSRRGRPTSWSRSTPPSTSATFSSSTASPTLPSLISSTPIRSCVKEFR